MMYKILLCLVSCLINEILSAASSNTRNSGLNMGKFMEENLICHNKYRDNHGVKPLSYNDELNNVAQKYADFLAVQDAGLVHSLNGLGENLYFSKGMEVDGFSACNYWYDEIKDYNFEHDHPSNFKDVGHFTALVWKGSCFMGVGISTSKTGWTYVVTNYDPAGNGEFKFRSNVFKPGTPLQKSSNKSPFDQMMTEEKVICSDGDRKTLLEQNLECQNMVRKKHGVPPLTYTDEMNNFAQKQAESFAKTGQLDNGNYGIIMYSQQGGKKEGYSACKSWYQGSKNYNYNSEDNPDTTYSFTQMVWKSSSKTGFGLTRTNDGNIIVISVYDPPGNFGNEFRRNVLLPVEGMSVIVPKIEVTNSSVQSTIPLQRKSNIDLNKFKQQNLMCHNKHREEHGVKPLSYNDQLNNVAQKYAEYLASRDQGLVHSTSGFGENLYYSIGNEIDGQTACNSWYDEIKHYNYDLDQPNNFKDVGHFTALVWKGTCFMGIGIATSRSGWTYVVANYDPAGNIGNKFRTNVLRPGSKSPPNANLSPFDAFMNDDKVICSDASRNTFHQQNLECHNIIRQRHGVPPLTNSNELNEYAQMQADSLAKSGKFNGNNNYGQNMYTSIGGKIEGYSACKSWYQSSKGYNYNSETNANTAFSFTQMVWKSSRSVGIGIARSSKGQLYVISVYHPPGNFVGQFKKNVPAPLSELNNMKLPPPLKLNGDLKHLNKRTKVDVAKFKQQNLMCHNKHRETHGVKPLSYSDQLNNVAQKYAEYLASRDKGLVHSSNGFGENLYYSWGLDVDGQTACNSWYDEIKFYNFDRDQPSNFKDVGHFTALVWKGTCFTGIGIATSKSGWTYVVANYDPAGNSGNKFRTNVLRPGSKSQPNNNLSPFDSLMNEDKVICSDADGNTFRQQNLECHNIIRQMHGVPPLSYSNELNEYAQKQADSLAKTGKFNGNVKYGRNMYNSGGGKIEGYSACKSWYQSSKGYNYNSEKNPNTVLSFTQMVWKSSSLTGIGIARSSSGQLFVISVYDPPGNYMGEYRKNVFPPAARMRVLKSHQNHSTSGLISLKRQSTDMSKFTEQNLMCHNKYREKHGVKPLTVSQHLNNEAQNYAEYLASQDMGLVHSYKQGLGENLYQSSGINVDGYSACNSWYDEIKDYDFNLGKSSNGGVIGHFTALVWRGTCFVGVGIATSKSGTTYIVANYDPAGNSDKYISNVFPPGTPIKLDKKISTFQLLMSEEKVVCTDETSDVYRQQNLECHNIIRKRHGASPLTISDELNEKAQKQAEEMAMAGSLIGAYGSNVLGKSGSKIEGYSACKKWYEKSNGHDYNSESVSSFTQMVWKYTQRIGFGIARSKSGKLYYVSVYDPPGQFSGEFRDNVLPPVIIKNDVLNVEEATDVSLWNNGNEKEI